MPKYDGTGPSGTGPKTGRCVGPCSTQDVKSQWEKEIDNNRLRRNRRMRKIFNSK